MNESPLTGGCNCGIVRFQVNAPLVVAHYCHCTRCQRRSGTAASINARAAPGSVHIAAGADRLRAWKPEDGREKWFCRECGSSLFSSDPGFADPIGIRMGTFDRDPGIRPSERDDGFIMATPVARRKADVVMAHVSRAAARPRQHAR